MIFKIILLIFLKNTDAVNLFNVPKTNYGLELDEQLQRYVNKLFYTLKIKKDFDESKNVRLLLKTYYSLKKIPEYKWKIYNEIRNMVYVAASRLDEFYDLIKEVFHGNDLYVNGKTTVRNENKHSDESSLIDPFRQFKLLNINNLFHYNILNQSPGISNEMKINNFLAKTNNNSSIVQVENNTFEDDGRNMNHYDLKVWKYINDQRSASESHRRIYGGRITDIENYPFAASVHINGKFACTSSIISKDLVITAASCLHLPYKQNKDLTEVRIRIGSDLSNQYGELVPAVEAYLHPHYDSMTLQNNLAIIKMDKHISFSKDFNIKRILYDRSPELLPSNVNQIEVLGWGNLNSKYGRWNQQLAAAHLNLYSLDDCIDIYSDQYVSEKHFCAGGSASSIGSGACMGDIGGAAIVGEILVGLISFGPPECGTPNVPTVFTKIGYYSDWIDRIIEKATSMNVVQNYDPKNPAHHNVFRPPHETSYVTVQPHEYSVKYKKYDEDILTLQEILANLALARHGTLDEIIYSDLANDFNNIIETATRTYNYQNPPVKTNTKDNKEAIIYGQESRADKTIDQSDMTKTFIIEDEPYNPYKIGMSIKSPIKSDNTDYPNRIFKPKIFKGIKESKFNARIHPEIDVNINRKLNKHRHMTNQKNMNNRSTRKATTWSAWKELIEDDMMNYDGGNKNLYEDLQISVGSKRL